MVRHLVLYGSLRRDQPDFEALGLERALKLHGPVTLSGQLLDLGPYPGYRPDGTRKVAGELFEIVEPGILAVLDKFEEFDPHNTDPLDARTGKGSLYVRRVVPNSAGLPAWVYVYNGAHDARRAPPSIPHGDWLRWLDERPPSPKAVAR